MQLLLKENVEKLGRRGDIVQVAAGYARNYLLPTKKAIEVTSRNTKQVERAKARIIAEEAEKRARLEEFAAILSRLACTVKARATEEGHLYGSVGPKEVASAVAEAGHKIEEDEVELPEHLKEVGVYAVPVRLQEDLAATIRIWVVPEGGGAEEPSQATAPASEG
ncbi:MAG: 50S ribosomal protein L9 [Planctomycetota bacterium]